MLPTIFGRANKPKQTPKEILIEFLTQKKFLYHNISDDIFELNMSGDNGNWKTLFQVDTEKQLLQIRSYCPIRIKDNQKLRIAELVTRLNSRILLG